LAIVFRSKFEAAEISAISKAEATGSIAAIVPANLRSTLFRQNFWIFLSKDSLDAIAKT
jgi:hypothetical protein